MRRIPTHLKLIRGNPGKRALPAEPEPEIPENMPEPPPFLAGYARDEWWVTGPRLVRLGLLTSIDLQAFAAYCDAYGRWRTAVETFNGMAERDATTGGLLVKRISDGNPVRNPLLAIAANAASEMVRFAGEFGFLQQVASELARCDEVGPGVVHRVCAAAQRAFFDAPDLGRDP